MNAAGRVWMAAVEAFKRHDRSDPDGVGAAFERMAAAEAAFAATSEGRSFLAAPLAVLDRIEPSEMALEREVTPVTHITMDAAAFEELKRQAAEAPALVEQARQVLANPAPRAGSVPPAGRPLVALSASVPAAEPSEVDWADFNASVGLGGQRRPRPLMVVDPRYPGGIAPVGSQLSGPSEAAFERFTSDLGLGSNPHGRYSR